MAASFVLATLYVGYADVEPNQAVSGTKSFISQDRGGFAPNYYTVNSTAWVRILVNVRDSAGRPLAGKRAVLRSDRGSVDTINESGLTSDGNGKTTFLIKSDTPGLAILMAEVEGVRLETEYPFYFYEQSFNIYISESRADLKAYNSDTLLETKTAKADGQQHLQIKVTVRNADNLPLPARNVILRSSRGGIDVISSAKPTGIDGTTSFFVSSTTPGKAVFVATVDGATLLPTATIDFVGEPVATPPPAPTVKPDLLIEDLQLSANSTASSPWISLKMCNRGESFTVGFPLTVIANGRSQFFDFSTLGLDPGRCSGPHAWPYSTWEMNPDQSYTVTAIADASGQISETDENNNTLEAVLDPTTSAYSRQDQTASITKSFINGLAGPDGTEMTKALINVKFSVTVYIRNKNDQPLVNKIVSLTSSRPGDVITFVGDDGRTNRLGQVGFYIASSAPGMSILSANIDGQTIADTFEMQVLASALAPDLVVQSVTFDMINYTPHATIVNRGTAAVSPGNFSVSFTWYDNDNRLLIAYTKNVTLEKLDARGGMTVVVGVVPPSGAFKLNVIVDPNNTVEESWNNNNSWEGNIEQRPDLVIKSIIFDPATRFPTVEILNQGTGPAVANFFVDFLYLDRAGGHILGDNGGSMNLARPEPLVAGAIRSFSPWFPIANGAVTLRVNVDPGNLVHEVNKNNNSRDVAMPAPTGPAQSPPPPQPSVPPAQPAQLPDLIIETVTFNQATRRPTVVIRNQGNAPAVANFFASFSYLNAAGEYINNAGSSVNLGRPASLSAGETRSFGAMSEVPAVAITVRIEIDRANQVMESDETNNTRDEVIPPPLREIPPDLTVESVTFPTSGGARVVIKNVGGQAVTTNFLTAITYYNSAGILRTFSVRPATVRPIQPNTTRVLVSKRTITKNATHFRVTADSANQIAEASEINNAVEGQIVIGNAR